jgi:hypothetical protein
MCCARRMRKAGLVVCCMFDRTSPSLYHSTSNNWMLGTCSAQPSTELRMQYCKL